MNVTVTCRTALTSAEVKAQEQTDADSSGSLAATALLLQVRVLWLKGPGKVGVGGEEIKQYIFFKEKRGRLAQFQMEEW